VSADTNVLGAIADTRAAFIRTTGRPPARIKVGHEFLMKLADETLGFARPRLTRDEHRQKVLDGARRGEVLVYGMKVEYQPPGREHG